MATHQTKLNNELERNLLANNTTPPNAIVKLVSTGPSWITIIGFGFLSFNCCMAVYRSRDDFSSVLFVVSCFLDLILLFYCLQKFEKTPRDSPTRDHLKKAVWSLSTFLTLMFSYRVAALMPLAVAIIVWVMSLSTIGAGFYLFFIYREEIAEKVPSDEKSSLKMAEGP
jgi:FlaA1/EpsC-like NDP-sugar epimerase